MLPYATTWGGINKLDFSQSTEFNLGISSTFRGGACNGLSWHWIAKHKNGRQADFPRELNYPSTMRRIERLQHGNAEIVENETAAIMGNLGLLGLGANYKFYEDSSVVAMARDGRKKKSLAQLGSDHKSMQQVGQGPDADTISRELLAKPGYKIIAFTLAGEAEGHSMAAFRGPTTLEFFDPNFGSAEFTMLPFGFIQWFKRYWTLPSGPAPIGKKCAWFRIQHLT